MRILLLVLLASFSAVAQTQMASVKTKLHKQERWHEAFMASDSANSQLMVFMADKENLKALRFNRAVFFSDSLVTTRPAREFQAMEGYSFNGRNATVYYRDEWVNKVEAVNFDFDTKGVTKKQFKFTYGKNEDRMFTFSANNSFYLLTLLPKGQLRFSIFNGTGYADKVADFSSFHIVGADNKKTSLNYLIKEYGMQKIEAKTYNNLIEAGNKIKFYVLPDKMLLTLDNNPEFTQVFTINPNTFEVTAKSIPQAGYEKEADANSYYSDGKLYHILLTEDAIRLSSVDPETGGELKNYSANKSQDITFKNTPLYTERGVGAIALKLDNTEKFLRKARGEGAAISVYGTPDGLLVTSGSVHTITPAENLVVGLIASGPDIEDVTDVRTTYFESLFDAELEHKPGPTATLAIDAMSASRSNNKSASMHAIIPYKGYYIMGFYDKIIKSYVLSKYEDGNPE